MSNSGQKERAYPTTQSQIRDMIFYMICGGFGGGGCAVLLGATHYKYRLKVPKFVVYNKKIILSNPIYRGVDIHTDAGAGGGCSYNLGSRVPWYLSFSADGNLTDAEMALGTQFNSATPYDIEVRDVSLPQPTDVNWENAIWVHIYWGNSAYVNQYSMYDGILKLIKHDYEIKL